MAAVNPIELQKALGKADYPASGEELADLAQRNHAKGELIDTLKTLGGKRFDGPDQVQKAVFHGK